MLAAQRVFCIARMIEQDHFPIFIGVATFALHAKAAFMLIVFFVAGDASGWRAFELGVAMAVLASDVAMLAR